MTSLTLCRLLLVLASLLSFLVAQPVFSQESNSRQRDLDKSKETDQKSSSDTDDSKPRPLTIDELAGEWTATKIGDDQTLKTKVKLKADETGKRLILEGKYKDWKQEGEVANGKVVFTRKPTADQMSEKAPKWAREDVQNQGELKWRLELKGEFRNRKAHLEGKWFPGEFEWRTAKGAHPDMPLPMDKQVRYLGEGKPVDVEFKKPMPKFFLYAKCVNGLQSITDLYLGVPTLIEAQFEPEYDGDEYPVTLKSGDQELKLTARKIDKKGIIFRTDLFVPGTTGGANIKPPVK